MEDRYSDDFRGYIVVANGDKDRANLRASNILGPPHQEGRQGKQEQC